MRARNILYSARTIASPAPLARERLSQQLSLVCARQAQAHLTQAVGSPG